MEMGLCANNALVLSGLLRENHLSGSGILQRGPEDRRSVLKRIFLLLTVPKIPFLFSLFFCFVLNFSKK